MTRENRNILIGFIVYNMVAIGIIAVVIGTMAAATAGLS